LIYLLSLILAVGLFSLFLNLNSVYSKRKVISYKYKLPRMITRKVRIDKKFSKKEKKIILQSFKEWEEKSCGLIKFIIINHSANPYFVKDGYYYDKEHIPNCNTIDVVRAISSDDIIKYLDGYYQLGVYGFAYGDHEPGFILIVMNRLKTKKAIKDVTMHEIGHMLGIMHLDDEYALMHKYYDKSKCKGISNKDIRSFIYNACWDPDRNPSETIFD
jgi:hypothetical protein